MRVLTALAVSFALLVACGPAAQSGEGDRTVDDVPIAGGSPQQSGGPVEPTATAMAPMPEPPVDPNATAIPDTPEPPPLVDPTATLKAPPPTRAAHVDDEQPEPTGTPDRGTPVPTPDSPILDHADVPDGGIYVCYGINPYNTTIEKAGYLEWCHGALVDDVVDNCSDGDSSAAELSCAEGRLASVEMYMLREVLVPCSVISDRADRVACFERVNIEAGRHLRVLLATWGDILHAVDSTTDVKAKKVEMADCVVKMGHSRPDPESPLRWQEQKGPDGRKALGGDAESVAAAAEAQLTAIDECSVEVGLYAVQEAAWTAEIVRLQAEDAASVEPLIDNGIVEALQADGVASFLTPGR